MRFFLTVLNIILALNTKEMKVSEMMEKMVKIKMKKMTITTMLNAKRRRNQKKKKNQNQKEKTKMLLLKNQNVSNNDHYCIKKLKITQIIKYNTFNRRLSKLLRFLFF